MKPTNHKVPWRIDRCLEYKGGCTYRVFDSKDYFCLSSQHKGTDDLYPATGYCTEDLCPHKVELPGSEHIEQF